MGHIIAMAGKGGTGKTTLAALLVRIIRDKKLGSILAVDADPNSNLAECLGLKPKGSIGEILDEVARYPERIPAGMPKERFIEFQAQTHISEGEGFDVLTMGKPEGPGCYCYVNSVLRSIMEKLIKNYDFVVIDNEAGLEHLSRRTTRQADSLVVVSDSSAVGLRAAKRISELVKELAIQTKNEFLLINRQDKDVEKEKLANLGLQYLGNIPSDAGIEKISLNGNSMLELENDSASITALLRLGERIWQRR